MNTYLENKAIIIDELNKQRAKQVELIHRKLALIDEATEPSSTLDMVYEQLQAIAVVMADLRTKLKE